MTAAKTFAAFLLAAMLPAMAAHAQSNVSTTDKFAWSENCGWLNWHDAGSPVGAQGAVLNASGGYLAGFVWGENIGWVNLGGGAGPYANTTGANSGVNFDPATGRLSGYAWAENAGWINFSGGALATPAQPARLDASGRLRGYAWGENIGWINLDDAAHFVAFTGLCGSADFNGDGDIGTDADIEAFFACLGGNCCPTCGTADFNGDGDIGTDADIEAFFRVLAGGSC